MKRKRMAIIAAITGVLTVMSGWAIAAQDKYTVKVPNLLSFAEFRGYEDWKAVCPSHTDTTNVMRLIVANPVSGGQKGHRSPVFCELARHGAW